MNKTWKAIALACAASFWMHGCASCVDEPILPNPLSEKGPPDGSRPPAIEDGGETTQVDGGPIGPDPFDLGSLNKDFDCDGLSDAEEFSTVYASGKNTSPSDPDSDDDGLLDGLEAGKTSSPSALCTGFAGDADTSTRTSPTEADSDADGLKDGTEDANRNGRIDAQETDPNQPDSDKDGLVDGTEDANQNGVVDPGESNPLQVDSDADKINDGIERNITLTDPANSDTDGDGCQDGVEDLNQDGVVQAGETNPKLGSDCGPSTVVDTDNDGLPDRLEDTNSNGLYEPALGETHSQKADTDDDGLMDGLEDRNRNGRVDLGETDPRRIDSDCDGLLDGPNQPGRLGEDFNADGVVGINETNPIDADSDGDGLRDGLELGVTTNLDPTRCTSFVPDADPSTTTSATKKDTDGDGIDDGAEDINQNGRVDAGELDPNNPADGSGPAGQVCTQSNLRPVVFATDSGADLQLGLPATFTQLQPMVVGGQHRGLMGYDSASKVAFVAWKAAANLGASTPTQHEANVRSALASVGALSNITTQTFTTWDSLSALQAFYQQANSKDLKAHANALAEALVGPGAGVLTGSAGVTGDIQLQLEVAHRSAQAVIYVLALTPKTLYVEPGIFSVNDTAGGSALAQFGDATAIQCETFAPGNSKVDFLFVVDDSGSMGGHQKALGKTADYVSNTLNNSTLDWRIGMVTTSYLLPNIPDTNQQVVRGFTRNIHQFRSWLTEYSQCDSGMCLGVASLPMCDSNGASPDGFSGGCWVGIYGTGSEGMLGSARSAVINLSPASLSEQVDRFRADADVVVIFLGDADDQTTGFTSTNFNCVTNNTCENIQNFINFFNNTGTTAKVDLNPLNRKIVTHGIVCPEGSTCGGEAQATPRRNASVITSTGGIRGDILDEASIQNAITNILTAVINAAGYQMKKPPLGASVKVALSQVNNAASCNAVDLPRSRINGFDFDGVNRTLSLFGACRPPVGTTVSAAVSYRYWVDKTNNPNGTPPPCVNDPFYAPLEPDFCRGTLACDTSTDSCECPANCGGTPGPGRICNPNKYVCDFVCTADCGGGCGGYEACNTQTCTCQCLPNATCAPGYTFKNSDGVCGCVCDAQALGCGQNFQPDLNACACVCRKNCGGCEGENQYCNPSTCVCESELR